MLEGHQQIQIIGVELQSVIIESQIQCWKIAGQI